jgi:hypothetical protein
MLAGSIIFLLQVQKYPLFKLLTIFLIWFGFAIHSGKVTKFYSIKFFQTPPIETNETTSSLNDTPKISLPVSVKAGKLPNFIEERVQVWSFYLRGIIQSPKTILWGHLEKPDRARYPSAHNYYLDLVYNFGLIAMIPLLYLAWITLLPIAKFALNFKFPRQLWMLSFVIFYFVIVENTFKVAFRQPYPGLMMFFLWGIFVERLRNTKNAQG